MAFEHGAVDVPKSRCPPPRRIFAHNRQPPAMGFHPVAGKPYDLCHLSNWRGFGIEGFSRHPFCCYHEYFLSLCAGQDSFYFFDHFDFSYVFGPDLSIYGAALYI